MAKIKPYPRRELKRLRSAWLQRNLRLVLGATVTLLAIITIVTLLLLTLGHRTAFTWYALGLLHTTLVAAYLHVLHSGFIAHDRAAISQLRGAWGEENTREELKRAKRRGLIWGWVDSIDLQIGDLDHLVVTRTGGLIAIDTKWRTDADRIDPADMARTAGRVRLRADALTSSLWKGDRAARHRTRSNPMAVTAVVVLWGAAQHTLPPGGARVDGIDFVAGRHLVTWLAGLDGQPVSKDAASDVLQRVRDFREGATTNA